MIDPTTVETYIPYGCNTFLNLLPAYDSSLGVIELLELSREIQQSGNYYWIGKTFPEGNNITIAAQATVSGSIQIPVGSYVTAINYYGASDVNPEGFKFKLFDKGTKAPIFYGDYCLDRIVASNMQIQYGQSASNPPSDPGSNLDNPFGPGYLVNPFIITPPGTLGWEIVNLSVRAAVIQVLLTIAVPISDGTINQKVVSK